MLWGASQQSGLGGTLFPLSRQEARGIKDGDSKYQLTTYDTNKTIITMITAE